MPISNLCLATATMLALTAAEQAAVSHRGPERVSRLTDD